MIDDFVQFARNNYQAPVFNEDEFQADLGKIIVLKKMFRRYTNDYDINERLALNNIIIILNQFGIDAANVMLFCKVEQEHHGILKTFLMFLNSYRPNFYADDDIELDEGIIEKLRDITCRSRLQF